jgi:hypothetical protein
MAEPKEHLTVLDERDTYGLGRISLMHPPGTFALTPASHISVRAVAQNQKLLSGIGIDWGSGTGCLSVVSAKIPAVNRVVGLEISESDIRIARENARVNAVENKLIFIQSDSFSPFNPDDHQVLDEIKGKVTFILANPPASEEKDGFEYRRIVLRDGLEYLHPEGFIFMSISYQYGQSRIENLVHEIPGFSYEGLLASTDWVPFDLSRPDLLRCLELYADEETHGGIEYTFYNSDHQLNYMNARSAMEHYCWTGRSPLSKWQVHLFRRC